MPPCPRSARAVPFGHGASRVTCALGGAPLGRGDAEGSGEVVDAVGANLGVGEGADLGQGPGAGQGVRAGHIIRGTQACDFGRSRTYLKSSAAPCASIFVMAAVQTSDEICALLSRLEGEEITTLQVLGINSLKSLSVMPDALAGKKIESARVLDRMATVTTADHQMIFDLQRTGKLIWLPRAEPYVMTAGSSRPTVRLVLASGQGLDLTEPAKTKRITVTLSTRT